MNGMSATEMAGLFHDTVNGLQEMHMPEETFRIKESVLKAGFDRKLYNLKKAKK